MSTNEGFTCPACRKPLQTVTICDTELEACTNGCGGIWFDAAELFRLDQQNEGASDPVLEKLLGLSSPAAQAARGKLSCIKCGTPMKTHEYRENSGIFVDECYACGGIWLDGGELKAIRENPAVLQSNKERAQMEKDFAKKVQDEKIRLAEEAKKRASRRRF